MLKPDIRLLYPQNYLLAAGEISLNLIAPSRIFNEKSTEIFHRSGLILNGVPQTTTDKTGISYTAHTDQGIIIGRSLPDKAAVWYQLSIWDLAFHSERVVEILRDVMQTSQVIHTTINHRLVFTGSNSDLI